MFGFFKRKPKAPVPPTPRETITNFLTSQGFSLRKGNLGLLEFKRNHQRFDVVEWADGEFSFSSSGFRPGESSFRRDTPENILNRLKWMLQG